MCKGTKPVFVQAGRDGEGDEGAEEQRREQTDKAMFEKDERSIGVFQRIADHETRDHEKELDSSVSLSKELLKPSYCGSNVFQRKTK